MTITRKVILDLLPLYVAAELSDDSRRIVEDYLKTEPELAELAKKMSNNGLKGAPPSSPSREAELKAFVQAKKIMLIRTVVWVSAFVLGVALLGVLLLFVLGRTS